MQIFKPCSVYNCTDSQTQGNISPLNPAPEAILERLKSKIFLGRGLASRLP